MHNPLLTVQTGNTTSPSPAKPVAKPGAGAPEHDFQHTLNRQIEQQRQQTRNASQAPPKQAAPARPPAPPAPPERRAEPTPAPQANQARGPGDGADGATAPARAEERAGERADNQTAAPAAGGAPRPTAATAQGKAGDEQSDTEAALNGPVADLLALVASLTQPAAQATAQAVAAPQDAATGAGTVSERGAALAGDGALLGAGGRDLAAGLKSASEPNSRAAAGAAGGASAGANFGASLAGAKSAAEPAPMTLQADVLPAALKRGAEAAPWTALNTAAVELPAEPAAGVHAVAAPVQQASLEIAQAASAIPTDKLNGRVGTPAWDQQLGQKVVWMVAGGEQSASLTLNPPDLGPLQVVLSVSNDQATATFTAAQPEVRQALEAAMPRLREMMSEAGIELGNATVSAGTSQQQHQDGAGARGGAGGRAGNHGAEDGAVTGAGRVTRTLAPGAVDTFA
ncbi:MAG: flagellar hook-length control protein FliK [Pseudomonadota bacterium]